MSELLVWREKLQKIYADKSLFIDKGFQFVLAFAVFLVINRNIGLMKLAASPMITAALAVICTFLPPIFIVIAASLLILTHMFALSMGVMAVSFLIFVLMFIFYCRFTPKRAVVILITMLAFFFKIPYVVPVVCGLVLSPAASIPVVFGMITYQMISCVKNSAAAITSVKGVSGQMTFFVKAIFQNKETWIMAIAFMICVLTVYAVKRISVEHAWIIAAAAGAVASIVVVVIGDIAFDVQTSYGMLILGNILAIAVGAALEFLLFSVDYSRTEHLQFEDDEYYYYVKAVPKLTMAVPDKKVKQINARKNADGEDGGTEEAVAVKAAKKRRSVYGKKAPDKRTEKPDGKQSVIPISEFSGNTEEILLAKQLQEELDIQNIVQRELDDQ